jgi:hypothetical protein
MQLVWSSESNWNRSLDAAASLETQDVEPDTKLFDSPSVEKHKADQPPSAEVPEAAAGEPRRRE